MAKLLGELNIAPAADPLPKTTSSTHDRAPVRIYTEKYTGDPQLGDVLVLARLPAHTVLCHDFSHLNFTAFGAGCTLDVGFEADTTADFKKVTDDGAGLTGKEAVLVSALAVATAGVSTLRQNLAMTDRGKALWQLAGLDRDPKKLITIVAEFTGANPASGTIALEQGYVTG